MAYGKGLRRGRVIPVHILRNSLIPVTTYLGADFGILIVGATVTEGIFNVPGRRRHALPGDHARREPDRRLVRHRDGHHLPDRQPAHRPALRACSTRGSAMSSRHPVAPHRALRRPGRRDAARRGRRRRRRARSRSNLWIDAWRDLRDRPMFWISGVLIVSSSSSRCSPACSRRRRRTTAASSTEQQRRPGRAGHPLGFTKQGCDIFSRIVHGTSTSLSVGLLVDRHGRVLGIVIGALAGFFGGWLDSRALAHRRHLLRDPLHPRGGRHHVGVLGQPERPGDRAGDRRVRLAVHRAHPALRGPAGQAVRLRHGLDGARPSRASGRWSRHVLPNSIAPVIVVDDDLARRGDHRRGDAVVPRRRARRAASCRGATTSARRRSTCAPRR